MARKVWETLIIAVAAVLIVFFQRIADYLIRLRLAEVERRFPALAPSVAAEVRRVVSDGVVSAGDPGVVDKKAARARVAKGQREELARLLEGWAREDLAVPGSRAGEGAAASAA